MSADIAWQVIRNNSALLVKRKNIDKAFSTERFNLTKTNSRRYNGFVNNKAVAVEFVKRGVPQIVLKRSREQSKPASSLVVKPLNKTNGRRARVTVQRIVSGYRPSLAMVAQRKVSQLLRSLRPKRTTPHSKITAEEVAGSTAI
ncbi:unnamed protein product, partial [Mesorhabditis spiculigera]